MFDDIKPGTTLLKVYLEHHIRRAFLKYCSDNEYDVDEAVQQMIVDLLSRARVDLEEFPSD